MEKFIIPSFGDFEKIYEGLLNEAETDQTRILSIQQALKDKGYGSLLGTTGKNADGVDGRLGPKTVAAIKKFQTDNGLTPDGIVGPQTAPKLGIQVQAGAVQPQAQQVQKTAAQPTTVNQTDTHLLFNGNYVSWVEGGKILKRWPAISGRSQYQWFITPDIWQRRYKLPPEKWATVKQEGPTPPGKYKLGPQQSQGGSDYLNKDTIMFQLARQRAELYSDFVSKYGEEGHEFGQGTPMSRFAWGNYRYALIKDPTTNTFGRGSMYLHGGSVPGSIGCVDLSVGINDFQQYYSAWTTKTGQKTIPFIVDYKTYDSKVSINHPNQPFVLSDKAMNDPKTWEAEIASYMKSSLQKKNMITMSMNGNPPADSYAQAEIRDAAAVEGAPEQNLA